MARPTRSWSVNILPILNLELTLKLDSPAVFHLWLPQEASDAVVHETEGTTVRFIFESSRGKTTEELSKTVNNDSDVLRVSVHKQISNELSTIIKNRPGPSDRSDQYRQLGDQIQNMIVERANRLIGYLRVRTGQYWLSELKTDPMNPGQFFMHAETVSKLDGQLVDFDPDQRLLKVVGGFYGPERSVHREQWEDVRAFVSGETRLPLIELLLSNARKLASQGLSRNALIDAVTALEVAVNRFAEESGHHLNSRFRSVDSSTGSIKSLMEKVGLRGAFAVAIPLLLTEEEFPAKLVNICKDAIELRNNLIHNGAREVKGNLTQLLNAADEACARLTKFGEPSIPTSSVTTISTK